MPDPTEVYDYRVISVNDAGESAPVVAGPVTGIMLRSVDFHNTISILRDDGEGAYGGPEWYDGNLNGNIDAGGAAVFDNGTIDNDGPTGAADDDEHNYPLGYVRSRPGAATTLAADLNLSFGGALGTGWLLKGSGGGFDFTAATAAGGTGALTGSLTADSDLADTIDSRKLQIEWQFSLDNGINWFTVGTTENQFYIAGAAVTHAYETVLHLGCEGAKGERPAEDGELEPGAAGANQRVVDKVWAQFSNNETIAVNGIVLRYNHDPDSGFDTAALLSKNKGRCGAWSRFLVDVLTAQGVAAVSVKVKPTFKNFAGYTTLDSALRTKGGPAQGSGGAAYGTTDFYDHAIVKVSGITQPNAIYDPSYGRLETGTTMAEAEQKWEDASIDSYQFRLRENATGVEGWTQWFADALGDELDFI